MSRVALTPSTDGRMLDRRRHSLNILQKDLASALIIIMMTMVNDYGGSGGNHNSSG